MKQLWKRAYTLVEVICVLAILAILAAVTAPSILRYIDKTTVYNCETIMATLVDEIRFDCVIQRFEDADAVNVLLEEKIRTASDTPVSFSHGKNEAGYLTNTCETNGICPNAGLYTLAWNFDKGQTTHSVKLTFTYACGCSEDSEVQSLTVNVALKQNPSTDYYDYLKSITLSVYEMAQLKADAALADGKTPSEIATDLTGRLAKSATIYRSRKYSTGTAVQLNSALQKDSATADAHAALSAGTDNNVLWGITINAEGKIEWMSYYCRYVDHAGRDYTHFLVVINGKVVTTKADYHDLRNASDQECNPPIEGSLGSKASKYEWIVKNGKGIQTIGTSYRMSNYNTHWTQRDGDWYVQGWGIYKGTCFGKQNLYSQRKLLYLSAAYVAGTDGSFDPALNLRVIAHYDDGSEVVLQELTEANMDLLDYQNGAGAWYLTNGYLFAPDADYRSSWLQDPAKLRSDLAQGVSLLDAFCSLRQQKLTISYQELYKYKTESGGYGYTAITVSCTLSRSMESARISYASGREEKSFAVSALAVDGQYRLTISYKDAAGALQTDDSAGMLLACQHRTAAEFAAGQGGYYLRPHSDAALRYTSDADYLTEHAWTALDVDVIYYAPATGEHLVVGRIVKSLDHLDADYQPYASKYFYLSRLYVNANYRMRLQDAQGETVYDCKTALSHRERQTDGFLLQIPEERHGAADAAYWAAEDDAGTLNHLMTVTGTYTLTVLYQDIVLCKTTLEITVQGQDMSFVWFAAEDSKNEVYITEYFGTDKDVVFPSHVTGHWFRTKLDAYILGYRDDELIERRNAHFDLLQSPYLYYYYVPDGKIYTVKRLGELQPSEDTDANSGSSSSSDFYREKYRVEMPEDVTSITISEGISEIGVFAFENGNNRLQYLTGTLTIPASVKCIGRWAFNSTKLSGLQFAQNSTLETIFSSAFEKSALTGDLVIPDTVKKISRYAFNSCSALDGTLTLGNGVEEIGEYAFSGLTSARGGLCIPKQVTAIGQQAFSKFGGDGDLEIYGGSIGTLIGTQNGSTDGKDMFANTSFRSITVGGNVTAIGASLFSGYKSAEAVTIQSGVREIRNYAFQGCVAAANDLVIPDTVQVLGNAAFERYGTGDGALYLYGANSGTVNSNIFNNAKFHAVTIGGSVRIVGASAFNGNKTLTGTLTILDGVQEIQGSSFLNCSGFSGDLYLPSSVTTIGNQAFSGNSGFTGTLTFENIDMEDGSTLGVVTIGENAFHQCSGFTGDLLIPASVTKMGANAFRNFGTGSGNLSVFGGANGSKLDVSLFSGAKFTDVWIGGNVESIGNESFNGNKNLTGNLTLASPVRIIGARAFSGCSGFSGVISLPDTLQNIGDSAFNGCSGFVSDLIVPESVSGMGSYAFQKFGTGSGALYLYGYDFGGVAANDRAFQDAKFCNVTIGGSIRQIKDSVFSNMSGLTGSLTIQSGVKSIGQSAFQGCKGFTGTLTLEVSRTTNPDGSVTVTGVETIGNTAFYQAENFSGDLIIPETVRSLGSKAFGSFGTYGGIRGSNPNRLNIDLSKPSLGSLYLYANCSIDSDVFSWTHFDGMILISGPTSISKTAFIGQTATSFVILGNTYVNGGSLARGYRHPKTYIADTCQVGATNAANPCYQTDFNEVPTVCPEGLYNGDVYVPAAVSGMATSAVMGGKQFTFMTGCYDHAALPVQDPDFYRQVCAAAGVTLPEDFDPASGEDPLAEALGCTCGS